jgi:acyl carrier protein
MIRDEDVERIRRYLVDELIQDDEIDLAAGDAIFSSGLLDSFRVTQLMTFLEDTFGVRISVGDVVLDDFDTIERILALLDRLKAGNPAR